MALTESPYLLYSDGEGNIFEDKTLYVVGRAGWDAYPIPEEDWIPLPEGGSLYELPGRRGMIGRASVGKECLRLWSIGGEFTPEKVKELLVSAPYIRDEIDTVIFSRERFFAAEE